jgi:Uma2 family endonuclease
MFAMAGGTRRHSLITGNLLRELGSRFDGRNCVAYNSDLRVKIEATGLWTYPDISVACGDQRFLDSEDDVLLNPLLIAEVLSESTEAYDRGVKFAHYRTISSLREYLLVSQWEPRIDQFIRQPGNEWLLRTTSGLRATLRLASWKLLIPLAKVFAKVQFPSPPIRPPTQPRR